MKTLVTGGTGFIGSQVVRELLAENKEVRCLVRHEGPCPTLDGLDVEIMRGNICDRDAVKRAMAGCNLVFHLAAIYAIWLPDKRKFYEVNVEGSRVVCEQALKQGVKKLVYTSSIATIGIKPGKALSDETTPFNAWKCGNDYVLTKHQGEVEALKYVEKGLPIVVVNPAFPFGERDIQPTPTGQVIINLCRGIVPGHYKGGINVVDVVDVAKGHIQAWKKGRIGERYILGNLNIEYPDFYRMVGEAGGFKPNLISRIPLNREAAILAGYLFEYCYANVFKRQPIATAGSVRYSAQFLYFDVSKARRELGYTTSSIPEAIERSIAWFESAGMLKPRPKRKHKR